MNLSAYIEEIKKIITAVSVSFNVEIAVFDIQCHLITSTEEYIRRKGASVHSPSLVNVLSTGNVLVNKPGYMPSCIGCRFQSQCPATIEILCTINVDLQPIGVISMTSFTEEGHERLTSDSEVYIDALSQASFLISALVSTSNQGSEAKYLKSTLQAVCDLTNDAVLFLDQRGIIKFYNNEATKFFPQCTLNSSTLNGIIPDKTLRQLLAGNRMRNKTVRSGSLSLDLSAAPVHGGHNSITGILIRIRSSNEDKGDRAKAQRVVSGGSEYIENIKGESEAIIHLKDKVHKISGSSSTVLITGETGTGKGMLAKAIHNCSSRHGFPFVDVNCSSIPETLFESELFGYEEGAFTGARRGGKIGKFELAQGGTLFLDEIGEMPVHMQPKLLHVLQEHCIERVGGNQTIPINVRVIAATNQKFEDMLEKGQFRYDLYYRLNVIPLYIPPLRERFHDIKILAGYFLKKYNARLNKHIKGFSEEVLSAMNSHSWPGNIRELENAVEYAVNIEESPFISLGSLPGNITQRKAPAVSMKYRLEDMELESISAALNKYGWDVHGKEKAAKELGISLRTLYRKIKSHE